MQCIAHDEAIERSKKRSLNLLDFLSEIGGEILKYLKWIVHSLLFLTVPLLAAYPQAEIRIVTCSDSPNETSVAIPQQLLSYDDVLDLLEDLDDGTLENRCAPHEIGKIENFMVLLARQGILPDEYGAEEELEDDIQELFKPSTHSFFRTHLSYDGLYAIVPAICTENYEIIMCGWWSHKWKKAKHFVKKHRKKILI